MKKGISLAVLSVLILIVLILASVISVSIIKSVNNSKKIAFATEIDMIQVAVNSFKYNNGYYPIKQESVVISNVPDEIKDTQFYGEILDENESYHFNVIDLDLINITDIKYGIGNTQNDKYAVSEITGKVYYIQGLLIENKRYYGIDDELSSLVIRK